MKRLKSKFILILVAVGIMALVIGIYFWPIQKQPKSKEFTGVREKVTICHSVPLGALILIAHDQGFFSHYNLDVTLREYPIAKMAMEDMFAGKCSMATVAETPIVFSDLEKQNFSIFATINTSDNYEKIAARKDKGIQKPGDLKGKRIATQKGTIFHFFLHMFLLKNGLYENDVKLIYMNIEELPEALAKGEIDAFSMKEPTISRAKELLGDNVVVFTEPGLCRITFNLVALNSFIKDKPDLIKKMLSALIQAEEFVKKYPDQSFKIVLEKVGIKESVMVALWRDFNLKVSLEQSLLLILEDETRWAIKNKLTEKTKVPNYLNFIYLDGLKEVKPEAVTIIR